MKKVYITPKSEFINLRPNRFCENGAPDMVGITGEQDPGDDIDPNGARRKFGGSTFNWKGVMEREEW